MNPQAHVLIGTPAYGGMIHSDYVNALLTYQHAGISFGLMTIGNESLITRARNTILSEFLLREEFTHLLFIDADVLLPAPGLGRLIGHDKDVIGAPVALKGRQAARSCRRIGTAVFMLSRRAVRSLAEDARKSGHVYSKGNTARGASIASVHYDVFRVGVVDDEYLSEDYWVCRSLRRLGYDIFVDPTIVTQHSGTVQV